MTKNSVVNKQNQTLNKTLKKEFGLNTESNFVSFISQYGLKILISLIVIALAIFLGIRFFTPAEKGSLKDYYQARTAYSKLVKQTDVEASLIAQVDLLMKKHPEIAPQYEGLLAQNLLNKGQSVASYTPSLFKRMESTLSPSFKEYAAISILISEKKFEDALARTQQLNQLLENQDTFYLPLFNLLRQAALAEQLGNKELELATWKEWQNRTSNPETHFFMKELFQEGVVSIPDYVKFRLQALNA